MKGSWVTTETTKPWVEFGQHCARQTLGEPLGQTSFEHNWPRDEPNINPQHVVAIVLPMQEVVSSCSNAICLLSGWRPYAG